MLRKHNDYNNYVFVDESKIKLNLNPLFVHRKKSTYPQATDYRLRNADYSNTVTICYEDFT